MFDHLVGQEVVEVDDDGPDTMIVFEDGSFIELGSSEWSSGRFRE